MGEVGAAAGEEWAALAAVLVGAVVPAVAGVRSAAEVDLAAVDSGEVVTDLVAGAVDSAEVAVVELAAGLAIAQR